MPNGPTNYKVDKAVLVNYNYIDDPERPIPDGCVRDGILAHCMIVMLEVVDFVCMVTEPFFKWLPIMGMLYVLVPYYNQFSNEDSMQEEEEEQEEG